MIIVCMDESHGSITIWIKLCYRDQALIKFFTYLRCSLSHISHRHSMLIVCLSAWMVVGCSSEELSSDDYTMPPSETAVTSSEATPSEVTPSEATPSEATPSEVTPSEVTPSAATYTSNPFLEGQFKDAVLVNRNPDCRAYAMDANQGNYGSSQIVDRSNNKNDSVSHVHIDMVIARDWNATRYDYDSVEVTTDAFEATHCRMVSNMIPNHNFGVTVTGPRGDGWIHPIDHTDTEMTYIPINPVKTSMASDTPRNPPVYDFDGILLNGVGIAMDSGFCYKPNVTSGPASLQSNAAGNASGCGPQNSWFELPAYRIWDPTAENMAAVFDDYFAHGFSATYHYHAVTHPLQEDDDQTHPPSQGGGSPVIGFAPDGFPIFGHWFVDEMNQLVKAESGYETFSDNSRTPIAAAQYGTPPTPWDIANNPNAFNSSFGLEMGRYEEDWFYAGTGNLDECNGAFDVNGTYGYYITDKYPFAPPCIFGVRDPSFGKRSPTLP